MPLNPALRRQRQEDLCEFEDSLVYRVSSRVGSKAIRRNAVSKNQKKERKKEMLCVCPKRPEGTGCPGAGL